MSFENLPILENRGGSLNVVGKIARQDAHGSHPVFHATAIIAAVLPDGKLLLADKTEKQRKKCRMLNQTPPPECSHVYDCFGGHMRFEDIPSEELATGVSVDTFMRCALREFSEELLYRGEDGKWHESKPDAARMVPLGMYELINDHNREYSWVFVYPLDSMGPYLSEDTLMTPEGEETIRQPIHPVSWDELMRIYRSGASTSEILSDAVGRILDYDGGEKLKRYMR